jgi:hypothetical protein
VVADDYQREGVGGALCAQIVAGARHEGVTTIRATALAENFAVRRLFAGSGAPYTAWLEQGVVTFEAAIVDKARD